MRHAARRQTERSQRLSPETLLALIAFSDCPEEVDVVVVGAGPAGLAAGFDLADRGARALILEAGGGGDPAAVFGALEAEIGDPDRHAALHVATRPGVGGTSRLWGGRIVPLDPADFAARDGVGPGWPIGHDDLLPWWRSAAEFLGGALVDAPAPGGFARLAGHAATRSETWGAELDMGVRWRDRLQSDSSGGPAILPGARVVRILTEGARAIGLRVRAGGETREVRARRVVLAAGGLGSLRLLLDLDARAPGAIVGAARLGRGYMGHLTGSIADLVPADPADIAAFGCLPRAEGGEARRRIQPTEAALAARPGARNIAFWLDNPPLGDPAHGSAAASAKYLLVRQAGLGRRLLAEGWRAAALRGERAALGPHLANVARAPHAAVAGLVSAAAKRLTDRYRRPERLLSAGDGGWRMHYHAEQGADPANRVSLADAIDADGLPRLRIEYGIGAADVASVVAAHEALDADLRAAGAGRLRHLHAAEDRAAAVLAEARDGYHQLGGAAMGRSPAEGVTDPDCAVFGVEGLYVASSAVFPQGGQANPTLTIVALARRLADHLARQGQAGSARTAGAAER